MIIISDKPADVNAIIKEYPIRSVERDIVNKLSVSNTKYYYDSLEQLKFELRLRKEIIEASKQLFRSGMSFKVFRKSTCNPKYWIRTTEGGFILKNNVKASDAIKDIFVNGSQYGTECATAMVIVYYKAILNIFPKQLFNEVFAQIHLMNWHNIDSLLEEVGYMKKTTDYLPGDRRYFINPDVDPLTAYMQGENVIDLNQGMYYGHGIGIQNANRMIRTLNRYRKKDATVSAYLLDEVARPNFKNLSDIYHQIEY